MFERYLVAGAMSRDPDAVAALFAEDGVLEWPLHRTRFAGRDEIRHGLRGYYARHTAPTASVDPDRSGCVLHRTTERDTFLVEIDTVFAGSDDATALVWIFRIDGDEQIVRLRDYFAGEA
ncbi:hypothetical protein JCM9534A_69630 [Catenuloplanes indicus JCM 9534]